MFNMWEHGCLVTTIVALSFISFSLQDSVFDELQRDGNLKNFLGNLEGYGKTKNDLVFVLDESGSIGIENFPLVTNFTELIARQLSVSADDSRLATITYSDGIRPHIDHIEHFSQENMCTFLHKLKYIDYKGGYTYTGDAMRYAQKILSSGRTAANKLIVLLTDGQSNGGEDLGRVAKDLKASGVIIFVVGVAKVNETELRITASSDHHVYTVKDFTFVSTLNQYLINDTKEVNYDTVSSSLCDSHCTEGVDCCDAHASCYCGTKSGKYECSCGAGFYGNSGIKGHCAPCPRGSYKSHIGNNRCLKCPVNSMTSKTGCTSISDCVCIHGHTGYPANNRPCQPIQCNALKSPRNGVLVPKHCGHSYNTKCHFKCNAGYCPYSCNGTALVNGPKPWHIVSTQSRTCTAAGTWTGDDFLCDKVKCVPLEHPIGGTHNCSDTDFSVGTVCKFTCRTAHKRIGSEYRSCQLNGQWDGNETKCQSVTCPPLKTNGRLYIRPLECGSQNMSYASSCQYYCSKSFSLALYDGSLVDNWTRQCQVNGTWSNHANFYCKDVQPPVIYCPNSKERAADYGKDFGVITWELPRVGDNVFAYPATVIEPRHVVKPPQAFPIGHTKVVYHTSDWAGNDNTCSFTVIVKDDQVPVVDFCPQDIVERNFNKSGRIVRWKEPKFSDNSGYVNITWNRKNGDVFKWGPPTRIVYKASDLSRNTAQCAFNVTLVAYSCPKADPPVNGFLTCDTWTNGQLCSVSCREGFEFPVSAFDPLYFCSQRIRNWTRVPGRKSRAKGTRFIFPWPDCSAIRESTTRNVSINVAYKVTACSEEHLNAAKKAFIQTLKARYPKWCIIEKGCTEANVNISCGQLKKSSAVRLKRNVENQDLLITYNFEIPNERFDFENTSCQENCTERINLEDLENIIVNVTGDTIVQIVAENSDVVLANVDVIDKPSCPIGSILNVEKCVNCPVGTFFNLTNRQCQTCEMNTYQDEDGSTTCKLCPNGSSTLSSGARNSVDCKLPCQPGTVSETGFEPCLACPKGTYQENTHSKHCIECPDTLTTTISGSHTTLDCVAACSMGTYSDNGLQPCTQCPFGTYQPFTGRLKCLPCMKGLTTFIEGADDYKFCQSMSHCEYFSPCWNGATCVNIENGYSCECPKGFTGRHCDINLNDCDPNLCENNATCLDGIGQFTCICLPGFDGPKCEFDVDDCFSGPCQNGICHDLVDGYSCSCMLGFSGRNCEVNIDDCASNPCLNGARCFDMKNAYRCCCPSGYTGSNCETVVVDRCAQNPCLNSGTCELDLDNYKCLCPSGFEGLNCENEIVVQSFNTISVSDEFALEFSRPGTSDYVSLENTEWLREITVSFFMQSYSVDEANRGTPVSYSYRHPEDSKVVDNGFTIFDTSGIILYIHGDSIHTGYEANKDDDWHHYALTWESFNGSWVFYTDGQESHRGNVPPSDYMFPGMFVLGQEQDDLGGGFSTIDSFVGKIFEFNVWRSALSAETVSQMSRSCGFRGDLIGWTDVMGSLNPNLTIISNFNLCQVIGLCSEDDYSCKGNTNSSYSRIVSTCDPNPCLNDHICDESSLSCDCELGYTGKFCQYDVDECLYDNGKCSHGCNNTLGSYFCTCPENMFLLADNITCQDRDFCKVEEKLYVTGDRWISSSCEDCVCNDGLISCEEKSCSNMSCADEEQLILLPGQCCRSCVSQTFCSLNDSIVDTFDGMRFKFSGTCSAILLEERLDGSLLIEVEGSTNQQLGKTLTIYESCDKLTILSDGQVVLNNQSVSLPYEDDQVHILNGRQNEIELLVNSHTSYDSIQIVLHNGIIIDWNAYGNLEIGASNKFKRRLSGLCGNFNGNPRDDLMNRSGMGSKNLAEFMESWTTDGSCEDETLNLNKDHFALVRSRAESLSSKTKWITLNCGLSSETRQEARAACSIFWSESFRLCHNLVDPNVYYILCLKSACRCKRKSRCFCDSILTYLMACAEQNVHITDIGAASDICRQHCPRKMVHKECGPACPATCNTNITSSHCTKWNCVPGCYCPEETVFHKGKCIEKNKCYLL